MELVAVGQVKSVGYTPVYWTPNKCARWTHPMLLEITAMSYYGYVFSVLDK